MKKKKNKYMKILLCRLQGDILNSFALLEEPPGHARLSFRWRWCLGEDESGTLVEWHWQGETEEPVPVPLCPPQIPYRPTSDRTSASSIRPETNRPSYAVEFMLRKS